MYNEDNVQHMGVVWVGNPPQKLKMQFDTGSEIVYILTDGCKSKDCGTEPKYNRSISLEFFEQNPNRPPINVYYGKGVVSGLVA